MVFTCPPPKLLICRRTYIITLMSPREGEEAWIEGGEREIREREVREREVRERKNEGRSAYYNTVEYVREGQTECGGGKHDCIHGNLLQASCLLTLLLRPSY